jgi:hypothetical protein
MAGFSAVILMNVTPVSAGFEWKAPAEAPVAPAPAESQAAPQGASQSASQGGAINWNNTPQMPAQKVQGFEAVPLTATEKKNMPPAASSDVITGFGKDLPLAVALQQVVPPQYKVSLSPGVDEGVHVSWKGDRPWEQALSDMLRPERLAFAVEGNTLVVKPATGHKSSTSSAAGRKADMIPAEMISGNANEEYSLPAIPGSAPVVPMTIRRSNPALVPAEAEAAPPPGMAQNNNPEVIPPPSWSLPAQETLPAPASAAAPVMIRHNPSAEPVQETASAPTVIEPSWHAEKGQTLRAILEDWSKNAHVQLYWSTDYDYRLNSDVAYGGSFDQAVGKLLDQFSAVKPQPYGQLHRNPETGGILVINTYGTYN